MKFTSIIIDYKYYTLNTNIIVILIQDKLTISLKGDNSEYRKEIKYTKMSDISKIIPDYIPEDLKVKLLNEFDRNRSKLDPFLI